MTKGYIYCFSHPMLIMMGQNVFKLGCSIDLKGRCKSTQTFMSTEMDCLHSESVKDKFIAENRLFEYLKEFRVRKDREFFKIDLETIKRVMNNVAIEINEEYIEVPLLEDNKNTIRNNLISKMGKKRMCLRCGEIYSPSLFDRHINRIKNKCKPVLLDISYQDIKDNYDKCLDLLVEKFAIKEMKTFTCKYCNSVYKHSPSLSRHKKECKDYVIHCLKQENKILKQELAKYIIN